MALLEYRWVNRSLRAVSFGVRVSLLQHRFPNYVWLVRFFGFSFVQYFALARSNQAFCVVRVGGLVYVDHRIFVWLCFVRQDRDLNALLRVVMVGYQGSGGLYGNVVRSNALIAISGRVVFFVGPLRPPSYAIPMIVGLLIRNHPLVGFRRSSINGRGFRFVFHRIVCPFVRTFDYVGVRPRGDTGDGVVKYFHFPLAMRTGFFMHLQYDLTKEVRVSVPMRVDP